MTTKEFIITLKTYWCKVAEHETSLDIYYNGELIAYVSKITPYEVDTFTTGWENLNKNQPPALYKIIHEYISTPIDLRESPTEYMLEHKYLKSDIGTKLHLGLKNFRGEQILSIMPNPWVFGAYQTKFTKKEIETLKNTFNTNFEDFELSEIGENNEYTL